MKYNKCCSSCGHIFKETDLNKAPKEFPCPACGQEIINTNDPVNHPSHYTQHPSGIECITITEHMNFCRGNAIKYIWRAGDKGNELEDLRKAAWYLDREIKRLEKGTP